MDYGKDTAPMGCMPRMELFDQNLLGRLILADTQGLKRPAPSRVFGAGKVIVTSFWHLWPIIARSHIVFRCFGTAQVRPAGDVVYKRQIGCAWSPNKLSVHRTLQNNGKRPREIFSTAKGVLNSDKIVSHDHLSRFTLSVSIDNSYAQLKFIVATSHVCLLFVPHRGSRRVI